MSQEYLLEQKQMGWKVGDRVVICRTANDEENGWENSWAPSMSNNVGRTGKIREITGSKGIRIKFDDGTLDSCVYPHFVLGRLNDENINEENLFKNKKLNVWCQGIATDPEKRNLLIELVKNHPTYKNYEFGLWYNGKPNFYILQEHQGVNYIGFYGGKEGCFSNSKIISEEELFEILGHKLKYKPFFLEFNIEMRFHKIA